MSDETARLKAVQAEKPQLSHSPSNQSFAATSENASSENVTTSSSVRTQLTALRHESPPSRTTTPPTDKEPEESEMTLPQRPEPVRHNSSRTPPHLVPPEEDDRVTPGIDNTPYIRFGLNQLTIDEEVAGKGRYSSVNGDYQVDRIISDQNLGYYQPGIFTGDPPPRKPSRLRQHSRLSTRRPHVRAPTYVTTKPRNTKKYPELTYTKVLEFQGTAQWRWTSVQGVVWTLVALYAVMIVALIVLLLHFSRHDTGLRWDPTSLADIIPMFQKSDIISDYDRSEVSSSMKARVPAQKLHLGYWRLSDSSQPFYAVATGGRRQNRPSFEAGRTIEKPSPDTPFDVEQQRSSNSTESFNRLIHSADTRYRWIPWFLRDSAVVAWSVIAVILFVAFLVVSFVHSAVRQGFSPHLPTAPDNDGFSSSNFLFSFLPALLATFLSLAYQPIDVYFRAIQPFASLSDPSGASAKESLLLSYPARPPILVSIDAVLNRHYKVAFISFVALTSFTLPILAGGVFVALSFPGPGSTSQIRIVAFMPAFYALIAFLVVYTFSFLVIWPTRRRCLPHGVYTLADLLSFVYQSQLLTDSVFRDVKSKQELTKRFHEGGHVKRYAFGTFVGRDGNEHLGIDKMHRPGSGEALINPSVEK